MLAQPPAMAHLDWQAYTRVIEHHSSHPGNNSMKHSALAGGRTAAPQNFQRCSIECKDKAVTDSHIIQLVEYLRRHVMHMSRRGTTNTTTTCNTSDNGNSTTTSSSTTAAAATTGSSNHAGSSGGSAANTALMTSAKCDAANNNNEDPSSASWGASSGRQHNQATNSRNNHPAARAGGGGVSSSPSLPRSSSCGSSGSNCPSTVINVDLSQNAITGEGVRFLMQFFEECGSLVKVKCLKLFKNSIDDIGALAIARYISTTSYPLEELHMSHNRITNEGAKTLFLAFSTAEVPVGGGQQQSTSAVVPSSGSGNQGKLGGVAASGPQYVYPRYDQNAARHLPVWVRLEYNNIVEPQDLMKDWSSNHARNRKSVNQRTNYFCLAERNPHTKDPHCSPIRCVHAVRNDAPVLHLYSFFHQGYPSNANRQGSLGAGGADMDLHYSNSGGGPHNHHNPPHGQLSSTHHHSGTGTTNSGGPKSGRGQRGIGHPRSGAAAMYKAGISRGGPRINAASGGGGGGVSSSGSAGVGGGTQQGPSSAVDHHLSSSGTAACISSRMAEAELETAPSTSPNNRQLSSSCLSPSRPISGSDIHVGESVVSGISPSGPRTPSAKTTGEQFQQQPSLVADAGSGAALGSPNRLTATLSDLPSAVGFGHLAADGMNFQTSGVEMQNQKHCMIQQSMDNNNNKNNNMQTQQHPSSSFQSNCGGEQRAMTTDFRTTTTMLEDRRQHQQADGSLHLMQRGLEMCSQVPGALFNGNDASRILNHLALESLSGGRDDPQNMSIAGAGGAHFATQSAAPQTEANLPLYVFLDASAFLEMRELRKNGLPNPFSLPGILSLCRKKLWTRLMISPPPAAATANPAQEPFANLSTATGRMDGGASGPGVVIMLLNALFEEVDEVTKTHPLLVQRIKECKLDFVDELSNTYGVIEKAQAFSHADSPLSLTTSDFARGAAMGVTRQTIEVIDFAAFWADQLAPMWTSAAPVSVVVTANPAVCKFHRMLSSSRSNSNHHCGKLLCVDLDSINRILRGAFPFLSSILSQAGALTEVEEPPLNLTRGLVSSSVLHLIIEDEQRNYTAVAHGARSGGLPCSPGSRGNPQTASMTTAADGGDRVIGAGGGGKNSSSSPLMNENNEATATTLLPTISPPLQQSPGAKPEPRSVTMLYGSGTRPPAKWNAGGSLGPSSYQMPSLSAALSGRRVDGFESFQPQQNSTSGSGRGGVNGGGGTVAAATNTTANYNSTNQHLTQQQPSTSSILPSTATAHPLLRSLTAAAASRPSGLNDRIPIDSPLAAAEGVATYFQQQQASARSPTDTTRGSCSPLSAFPVRGQQQPLQADRGGGLFSGFSATDSTPHRMSVQQLSDHHLQQRPYSPPGDVGTNALTSELAHAISLIEELSRALSIHMGQMGKRQEIDAMLMDSRQTIDRVRRLYLNHHNMPAMTVQQQQHIPAAAADRPPSDPYSSPGR